MQRERSLEQVRFEGGQRAIRPLVPLVNATLDESGDLVSLGNVQDFIDAARRACETLNTLADPGTSPHHEGERDLYDASDIVACCAATIALDAVALEGRGLASELLPFEGGAASCAARLIHDLWKKWDGRDLLDSWEQGEQEAKGA